MNLKLLKIVKSSNPKKKLDAYFKNEDTGREKKVSFGASGYSDFTKHKDPERKARYDARHKEKENWNKPDTPGALAKYILWNKPTLKASKADYKKRFNI
jgi:hypothetical protein